MILYLTGPSGAGKSSAGGLLAERAGRRFVDLDRLIEEYAGKSVTEVFNQDGERTFRALEKRALYDSSICADAVVATGGGIVLDRSNRLFMRERGKVFLLVAAPKVLLERIAGTDNRPLLQGCRKDTLIKTLFERAAAYCDADGVLDTSALSLSETVSCIIANSKFNAF